MTRGLPGHGPPDDRPHPRSRDREARAAFRAFVRANHPDVGGDPHEFATGIVRLRGEGSRDDGRWSGTEPVTSSRYDRPVYFVARRGAVGGTVDRVRRWRDRRKRPPRVI